jgi:hypothetical protein
MVSAQVTLDLTGIGATSRVVTAWLDPIGAVFADGPRSAQITLHQAVNYATVSVGPARFIATGTGNVVLYVRSEPAPGSGGPLGSIMVLRNTSMESGWAERPGATGSVATGG